MIVKGVKSRLQLTAITTVLVVLAGVTRAHAEPYTGPIKELPSSHIGWEVNEATKGRVCLVASEKCQPGKLSGETGGFEFANGVAVDDDSVSLHYGDVYVIDNSNRVQEITGGGQFVSMFGWEVNRTKDEQGGATQAEKNVCTAVSGNVCKAGVAGSASGQFGDLQSITVDPTSGDVYVADRVSGKNGGEPTEGTRVQKFTADGQFLLEIGKEVNGTTKGNICSQEEVEKAGVKCVGPGQNVAETTEPGAFVYPHTLAAGGPEDLLYVGDEHRVQEFEADGHYKREIPLTSVSAARQSRVTGLAVDETGDVYLVYEATSALATVIHKFASNGEEVKNEHFPLTMAPRELTGGNFQVSTLAVDSSGRLAVAESEVVNGSLFVPFGLLVDGNTGRVITEVAVPASFEPPTGLAFSAKDELYAAIGHEILAYIPVHVAELATRPVTCKPASENDTSATFDCTLNGEVNPEGVGNTEMWFQWGKTAALGQETPRQTICTTSCGSMGVPVGAMVKGVRPNQTFSYRVAGYDQNVLPPESSLTSEKTSFNTPIVPPKIIGEPRASFVKSSSALIFGELNPENANTKYEVQYGTCEDLEHCLVLTSTAVLQSAVYGKIGATLEAKDLQPNTLYHYRLIAENEGGKASPTEGIPFLTAPAPTVQAETGSASTIGTTSAVVSGTINPGGQPATYTFELGVYKGAFTQYGIVFSESVGALAVLILETLALTGLQTGVTYAYRIAIRSGYGSTTGATATFTTTGLPSVLSSPTPLAMLSVPTTHFPGAVAPKCKRRYTPRKNGKCIKVKKGKGSNTSRRGKHQHGKGAHGKRR